MGKNYVITSDSTCDLTAEIIKENDIKISPLTIILGGKEYSDNVNINSEQILEFVDNGGDLPKTAAISIEEYKKFFSQFTNDGKQVIHFDISSKTSSCNSNAQLAAKEIGNVFVVDSMQLSSGQGLLVMKACDLKKQGKTCEETYEIINGLCEKVQTSFVLDRLDFLHKGGRCSLIQLLGAKFLKLHPCLEMVDGALRIKKKYSGNLKRSFEAYVADLSQEFTSYDKTRCFITHCKADAEYVEMVKNEVKDLFEFDEILISEAGTTVSAHCGRNTLGVLFIKN